MPQQPDGQADILLRIETALRVVPGDVPRSVGRELLCDARAEIERLRELLRRFGAADSALDESEDGNDMELNDELDTAYLAVLEEGRRLAENRS